MCGSGHVADPYRPPHTPFWHGWDQDVPLVRPAAGMALYETVTGDLTLFVGNGDHFLMIDVCDAAIPLASNRFSLSAGL